MATELPASVHFELALLHFEGLSPRSRNIGGALLCDRRFQLGMRAMTAVVKMLWGERREHGTMGAVQRLPTELPEVR